MATPNQLATSAAGFQATSPLQLQWVIAYLLQNIANNVQTPNQLAVSAATFQQSVGGSLPVEWIIAYLLNQIASGGGGALFSIPSGNYAGGAPNFTPAAGSASIAQDTSNGNLWIYRNGVWLFSGLTV